METRDIKIFKQSSGSRYLVMPCKLLLRTTTSVNGRIVSMLECMKKRVLHGQKARIHI